MKKLLIFILLLHICVMPALAADMEFTAPLVPEEGEKLMPYAHESFSDGIQGILAEAIPLIYPAFSEALAVCLRLAGIMLLLSIVENFTNVTAVIIRLTGAITIAVTLLHISRSMIPLGKETIASITTYGKLLFPVLTAALAAQGGTVTSGALYAGTAFFDTVLSSLINQIVMPCIYVFLALAIASCAANENMLLKLKDGLKGIITWSLKILLYIFTGYMTITGAVSGNTDAMAIKAAKVTISGVVPVVGGILSDASEAVIVSAGIMKNAAGVYGILAIGAVLTGPFIRLGVQYLMLKLTGTICHTFGNKQLCTLITDFSSAMGLVLASAAAVSLMLVISTVCFMKVIG